MTNFRSKTNYDIGVRNSILDLGDCVLIPKVDIRGKQKLIDGTGIPM